MWCAATAERLEASDCKSVCVLSRGWEVGVSVSGGLLVSFMVRGVECGV